MNEFSELQKFTDKTTGTIDGTFNLLVGMMGPYIGYSLGCDTQTYLRENMFIKNILLIFIIFFKVNTASKVSLHPINTFLKSFIIWIVFISFNRMRKFNTAIVIILFLMLFIVKTYRDYIIENESHKKELNETLKKIESGLTLGIIINILLGSLTYYNEKIIKFGDKFNMKKFIFGIKCGEYR